MMIFELLPRKFVFTFPSLYFGVSINEYGALAHCRDSMGAKLFMAKFLIKTTAKNKLCRKVNSLLFEPSIGLQTSA